MIRTRTSSFGENMSLSEPIFEALASLIISLSPTPWDARCRECYGDLRWVSFRGREKRIRCLGCKREWVKDSQGSWQIDVRASSGRSSRALQFRRSRVAAQRSQRLVSRLRSAEGGVEGVIHLTPQSNKALDATRKMSRTRLFILSIVGGLVITIVLTAVGLSVENKSVTGILLWQDVFLAYLVGPEPLLSNDAQGKPHYEGTPIHMLILPVGFLLSIPIYSIVSYLFLRNLRSTKEPSEGNG